MPDRVRTIGPVLEPPPITVSANRRLTDGKPDDEALEFLMNRVRSVSPEIRLEAARELGLRAHPDAAPLLLGAMRDPVPRVRAAAAAGLANLRDPAAVPALCEALTDADPAVRVASAAALEQVADERAIPSLRAALQRADRGEGLISDRLRLAILAVILICSSAYAAWKSPDTIRFLIPLNLLVQLLNYWGRARSKRSPFVLSLTRAIARVADTRPVPGLRFALDPLKRIARDRLGQQPETVTVCGRLVDQIEHLTEGIRDLPTPSSPTVPGQHGLPTPTHAASHSGGPGGA